MEQQIEWFSTLVNYFLTGFADQLSDVEYSIALARLIESFAVLFVGGCISALWGCFGALTSLRRSKRG